MDTEYLLRVEHDEYARRMDAEHKRQDKRLELLESSLAEVRAQSAAIERLAASMENMAKEQEKQGRRLEALEGRDGEMWRKVVGYVLTAVISAAVGFMFSRIGM